MTREDFNDLAMIMCGRPVSSLTLSEELLVRWRRVMELEARVESLKAELRAARSKKKADLEQALVAKEKTNTFLLRRNEVLRRQLTNGGSLDS